MNRFFLVGIALAVVLTLTGCSTASDTTSTAPSQKSDNTIQGGATVVKDEFTVGSTDCDGNPITWTLKSTAVFKVIENSDGTFAVHSTQQVAGTGVNSEGVHMAYSGSTTISDRFSDCKYSSQYIQRARITGSGGVNGYLTIHWLVTYDVCEGTFDVKIDKYEFDCE